jgi:hypothetical protein
MLEIASEGKNISIASQHLETAEYELGMAQSIYELEDYEKAKGVLGIVREYIERTVLELALITIPPIPFYLPGYVPIILFMLNPKTAVCISASKSGRMHGSGSTGMPDQHKGQAIICIKGQSFDKVKR